VLIDIDFFKRYNDMLGHQEGDACLQIFASVLRDSVHRAGDLAARYGGEEFCLVLPGADYMGACEHAETIRRACEARAVPHPASQVSSVVTVSAGVAACVPSEENSIDGLMARADAALYHAKSTGRNRVV
jgi:diguanylate cyclase (GGDEF)-like protein